MKQETPVAPPPHTVKGLRPNDPIRKTQQIAELMQMMSQVTETGVRFEYKARPESKVYLAGTFNLWDPAIYPMEYHLEDDVFRLTLLLKEGTYEYKFIVNGVWQEDAKCPERAPNGRGTYNSVIHVRCPSHNSGNGSPRGT